MDVCLNKHFLCKDLLHPIENAIYGWPSASRYIYLNYPQLSSLKYPKNIGSQPKRLKKKGPKRSWNSEIAALCYTVQTKSRFTSTSKVLRSLDLVTFPKKTSVFHAFSHSQTKQQF